MHNKVSLHETGGKDASKSGSLMAVYLTGKCVENTFFKNLPCITTCKDNETQKAWLPVFREPHILFLNHFQSSCHSNALKHKSPPVRTQVKSAKLVPSKVKRSKSSVADLPHIS